MNRCSYLGSSMYATAKAEGSRSRVTVVVADRPPAFLYRDSPGVSILFGSWSPAERRRRFLQVVAQDSRWEEKQEHEDRMAARAYHLEGLRREQKKRQEEARRSEKSTMVCSPRVEREACAADGASLESTNHFLLPKQI